MINKKQSSRFSQKASPLLPPILLFFILALIIGLVGLHEREQNKVRLQELTRVTTQQLAIRIENWVSARAGICNLLAETWAFDFQNDLTKFKRAAQTILKNYPGFLSINWIDSTWTIRDVNPLEPNRLALGRNLHEHPFPTVQEAIRKALATKRLSTTSPIRLLQGGNGFVAYIPVYADHQKFTGFINVVFRIDSLIRYCLNDSYINAHFDYVIYSDSIHPVYWKGNIPKKMMETSIYNADAYAKIIDRKWRISLFPTQAYIHQIVSPYNNQFIWFNLIFSFAIALLIWLLILHNRRLKQSEEHFRTLFDSASTWIQIIDLDGTIIDVNQAFLSDLSLSKESVIQKKFADFLTPDSEAIFKAILFDIKENKQFQVELKFQEKDQSLRYLECFGSVVFNKSNQPQFIILHEIDITKRRFYQTKLNESEERYRALSEQSITGVYLIQHGKLNYINPKFARIFGFRSKEEMKSYHSILDFIMDEDKANVQKNIQELLEGKQKEMHFELMGKKKDGSPVALETFGHRIIVNGHPAILGTFIDISERKKHLRTIRKLSKAIEQNPVATLITDVKGKIEYANPAFSKITGYALDEIKGTAIKWLARKSVQNEVFKDILSTLSQGKIWVGEFEIQNKNGQTFWARSIISPLKDKNGKITHSLTTIEDITERKKLENELVQKQKMEAIGRLAGGIAHDFNNLLTVINGYSELILHTLPKEHKLFPKIEQIFQAGERAKNLTSQLLAFSRKQIRQPSRLNLSRVVQNLEKMLTRLIGEDVEIVCELEDRLWAIESDKNQIEQIILNLAVNARQAMPDGGKIIIRTENRIPEAEFLKMYPEIKPGKYVQLSVEDTGIGMDEETQKHIFEPFFTTKPLGQGTGLGLATVYGIVKQNDGYIYVKSTVNQGTKFCIFFPAEEEDAENITSSHISQSQFNGNETIFLVEDDPAVRELTENSLKYFGYNVIIAQNGEKALEIFEKNHIQVDLLISDVIMPGIGGKKLVDLLHKKKPNLKVLFMSGYSEDQISKKGVLKEGINFIQKPFAPLDLVKRIREILDG